MKSILTITGVTFREAWRRWVVLIALALSVVFLLLYAAGFAYITGHAQDGPLGARLLARQGLYNFLLLAGLYVVHFLTIVLSIFVSVDAVSGEITSHTIQALVTKPMRRWQLLCGKWLGYTAMIVLYVAILSGGILAVTYLKVRYLPPHPLEGVVLLMLEAVVLVSLSLLCGTYLSTLTNGVTLFLLYGLAFIGTWVEQIGSLFQSDAAVHVGVVTSLVMPVEALWRRAAYLLQPSALSRLSFSPFSAFSVPNEAMVLYAALYGTAALLLAIAAFSRRDL